MKKIKLSRLLQILVTPMYEEDEVIVIETIVQALADLGYLNEERVDIEVESLIKDQNEIL
jgi:hypothetical protein